MAACLNFTLYSHAFFPWNFWRNDVRTLTKLCEEFAGGHFSIEIVQVTEERARAFRDGVIAFPTVLMELSNGRKQNLGNLAETKRFLEGRNSPVIVPAQSSAARPGVGSLLLRGIAAA